MPAPPFALTAEAHAARAHAAECAWHAAHDGEGVDDGAWPRGLRRGVPPGLWSAGGVTFSEPASLPRDFRETESL